MSAGVALVTGAGRRVGAALATHLAHRGFHVVVHVNRSRAEGQAVVDGLLAQGLSASLAVCDLTDAAAVGAMVDDVLARAAARYVAVNNASWFVHDLPGASDVAHLDASLAVHARAPFVIMERLARSEAPVDVFDILDQKLVFANPDYYAYTVGKFALWGAGRAWRQTPRAGFRVFGLLPGLLLTSGEQSQDNFEASRAANPLGRAIAVGDLTRAIDFALDTPGLPAQDFVIDAGETLLQRRRDVAFDAGLHGDATT